MNLKQSQKTGRMLSEVAFESIERKLPEADRKSIREFIYENQEWGLGVETIIDVLLEEDIYVDTNQQAAIVDAARFMNIDRGQEQIHVCK